MYKSVLRLTALLIIIGTSMWADSITLDGASNTTTLSTWCGGSGFNSSPASSSTPMFAPIVQAVQTATGSASGPTLHIANYYSSSLYVTGLSYTTFPSCATM